MKVYLVWETEENCDGEGCICYPRSLVRVYNNKEDAEMFAKNCYGGRVTEENVK